MASDGATIRHATREDAATIYQMIYELADYEKATSEVHANEEILSKTLSFSTGPDQFTPGYAKTYLAVAPEGDVAGMALYFYNYSTWTGKPGIYLEDLYVRPKYRKRGYGKALIKTLAQEVVRMGGTRLEWSCLTWNTPSLEFYKMLGATRKNEWVGLRADGEALHKLAES